MVKSQGRLMVLLSAVLITGHCGCVLSLIAGSGFWVPGGGVNPGESLMQAAVRECWEEAGIRT